VAKLKRAAPALAVPARQISDSGGGRTLLPRGGSVHRAVAEVIGSRIVRGDYPPGSLLPNEAAWAADFNVSRSAIREAIKILTAKSLLTSRPKVGTRVEPREFWNLLDREVLTWYMSGPDRAKVLRPLQQFRHIIEPEAAALASEHRTDEEMAAISAACERMATAPTLDERSAADVRFHLNILKASANELLIPLGVLIDSALQNLFVLITREAGDLHYAQDLHNNIERAIRKRKPNAARVAVRKLLENSDQMISKWAGRSSGR
jgi:DNA-binding FadR family transcriptional regulator